MLEGYGVFRDWQHSFLCPGLVDRKSSEASLISLTLGGWDALWVNQIRMISSFKGKKRGLEHRRKSRESEDLVPVPLLPPAGWVI